MAPISHPPVPQGLRDKLKDYPEHIQSIQDALNRMMAKPLGVTPLFEQAIWKIEGALSVFIHEAQDELEAAKQSGDLTVIERAKEKVSVMRSASFKNCWLGEQGGLWDYCRKYQGYPK